MINNADIRKNANLSFIKTGFLEIQGEENIFIWDGKKHSSVTQNCGQKNLKLWNVIAEKESYRTEWFAV